jgi:hypothetical protein
MRKQRSKFRKQLEKQAKINILKTWLTSFTMTLGVVFLVVVFIPRSPKASFIQVTSFQNEVYYQVMITDEDQALDLDRLKIVLSNQLEHYENPLSLGQSIGSFENLNTNTTYSISVMADKGFGYETLAKTQVQTKPKQGGVIANYYLLESNDDYFLEYAVDVAIFNEEQQYDEIFLYVSKIYEYEMLNNDFLSYDESYQIFNDKEQIFLESIYRENMLYHLVLVATLSNGEYIILDEVYFYTPFHPYAYFYVDYISHQELSYTFYHLYERHVIVSYEVHIIHQNRIIRKLNFQSNPNEPYQQEVGIIKNLKPSTSYEIKVYAIYTHPDSKININKQIHAQSIQTLQPFDYDINWTENEQYYEVTVKIYDDYNQFSYAFMQAYQILEQGEMSYYQYNSVQIIEAENVKTVIFHVQKNHTHLLEISIGLNVKDQFFNRVIIGKIYISPLEGD